jgi:hypothetical protein
VKTSRAKQLAWKQLLFCHAQTPASSSSTVFLLMPSTLGEQPVNKRSKCQRPCSTLLACSLVAELLAECSSVGQIRGCGCKQAKAPVKKAFSHHCLLSHTSWLPSLPGLCWKQGIPGELHCYTSSPQTLVTVDQSHMHQRSLQRTKQLQS